jgi:hypothetical protein
MYRFSFLMCFASFREDVDVECPAVSIWLNGCPCSPQFYRLGNKITRNISKSLFLFCFLFREAADVECPAIRHELNRWQWFRNFGSPLSS